MTQVCLFLIRLYQSVPLLRPRCRFWPSCSHYAAEALETHGLKKGLALSARRLVRCHPFGGSGVDLVPPKNI
jgi:putative membrane protein insertion efficiency factor